MSAKTQRFAATAEGQTGSLQTFTAPVSGVYTITAAGASGSGGNLYSQPTLEPKGGNGAELSVEVELSAGETLWLLVGQRGTCTQATAKDGTAGGGGGGSYIFRLIDAITNSDYQITKDSQPLEVVLVAPGGGGSNDTSYQGSVSDGYDGNGDTIYTPNNYRAYATTVGVPTTSSSKANGMGISQFISNDGAGGYYLRNSGKSLGGYGGGGCNDDARCSGGGWYGVSYVAYGWGINDTVTGITGANEDHGWIEIQWVEEDSDDGGITVTIPEITAAVITPNPASINTSALVQITVTDTTKTLYPHPFYSGEIYCGEA